MVDENVKPRAPNSRLKERIRGGKCARWRGRMKDEMRQSVRDGDASPGQGGLEPTSPMGDIPGRCL